MRRIVLVGAAALLLTACGPQAAAPEIDKEGARTTADAAGDVAATVEEEAPKVDGKPMWSSNRNQTAEENAKESFDRNGVAFGAATVDAFVQKAHDFTSSPPKGAETFKRANGDTLIYDPASNTFAVVTRDGAPRTMFKPDTGAAYWTQQKDREAARAKGKG